jgi:hypothetical protein
MRIMPLKTSKKYCFEKEMKMIMLINLKSGCGPDKKCILTMLAMGSFIGLFVCGVPLAVMTTLYLQTSESKGEHSTFYRVSNRITRITSIIQRC